MFTLKHMGSMFATHHVHVKPIHQKIINKQRSHEAEPSGSFYNFNYKDSLLIPFKAKMEFKCVK